MPRPQKKDSSSKEVTEEPRTAPEASHEPLPVPDAEVPAQAAIVAEKPVSAQIMPIQEGSIKDSVLYLVYLMYKSNILARNNLKEMLKVVQDPAPEDIAKYLVEESRK